MSCLELLNFSLHFQFVCKHVFHFSIDNNISVSESMLARERKYLKILMAFVFVSFSFRVAAAGIAVIFVLRSAVVC